MTHLWEQTKHRVIAMLTIAGLLLVGLAAQPAAADDLHKLDCSLKFIPSDAAFYSSMLRNREQIEAIANSRAWAKLTSLPGVLMARQFIEAQLAANSEFSQLLQLYQLPENQELVKVLGDMVSNEVFVCGGDSFVDFTDLIMHFTGVRAGLATAQLQSEMHGVEPNKAQQITMLRILNQNRDSIKVPDLIIGFKLSKTEPAAAQLKRLEALANGLAQQVPLLKERFKREKISGSEFLVLRLDGALVPWDKLPLKDLEQKPGEFDDLLKKLKSLRLAISLGIRDGYALLAFGESTTRLEKFGTGGLLVDRPELKVLEQHAGQKLTSIGYTSKALRARVGTSKQDVESLVRLATDALKRAELSEEQRRKIDKDLQELSKDVAPFIPRIGASVSCSFLTGRGSEGFTYDWSESPQADSSKPLTLLNHVGGSPLLAFVGRSAYSPQHYQLLEKWCRKVPGYLDEFVVPRLGEEQKEQYQQVVKVVFPLIERLGHVTKTMLGPALADGQGGIVLDAKIHSKQWHKALPPSEKPLPMLEPAIILGVSDQALLKKACSEYRSIFNEAIAKLHELAPEKIPDFQIPEPQSKSAKNGTLYSYPLPSELGLDEQIMPHAGVSEKVAVLTVSQNHAERLLSETPLKVEGGPLADLHKPRSSAFYCRCEGIVKVIAPWVDYGVQAALRARGGDDEGTKQQAELVLSHVRVVLEVLQVFRNYSSSTYRNGDMMVTHSEFVIRDL